MSHPIAGIVDDKYEIIRPIGRGGMGEVYLARDKRLQRQVALKFLRRDLPDGDWQQKFNEEATLLASLSHPNIVRIYDILETEDSPGLVMEYVDGRNLLIHQREHQLELADRLRILGEIASGLAASHEAGVAHCDLKAENVLIAGDGTAKVTDFGIAEKSGDESGDIKALGKLANNLLAEHHHLLSPLVVELLNRLAKGAINARSAADDFLMAWYEHSQSETPLPEELLATAPRKKRAKLALAAIAAVATLLIGLFAISARTAAPVTVAVLPAEFTSTGRLDERQQLMVQRAVSQTLQEYVIQAPSLRLVSEREIGLARGNNQHLMTALGAKVLVHSILQCAEMTCELSLQRIDGPEAEVTAQQSVGLLADDLLAIHQSVANIWDSIFPEASDVSLAGDLINEDDYRRYIELSIAEQTFAMPTDKILEQTAELIQRAPLFAPLYYLYSQLGLTHYEYMGDRTYLAAVDRTLSRARRNIGDSPYLLRSEFQLALYQKEFAEAHRLLLELEQAVKDEALTAFLYGEYHGHQNDFVSAEPYYRRAAALLPCMQYMYKHAANLFRMGEADQAAEVIQQSLQRYPYDTHALNLQGIIAMERGDMSAAIQSMEASLAIQPDPLVRVNLGSIYMLRNDFHAAREQFLIAYEADSRDSVLVLNLADSEQQLGNIERSESLYNDLVSRYEEADISVIPIVAAQAYAQLGRYGPALEILSTVQDEEVDPAINASAAALIYALAGQNLMALVEVDRSLDAGMPASWYGMPWYDSLCSEARFRERMSEAGYSDRCQDQEAGNDP